MIDHKAETILKKTGTLPPTSYRPDRIEPTSPGHGCCLPAGAQDQDVGVAGLPSESCLALHHRHTRFDSLAHFQPQLAALLHEANQLSSECISTVQARGCLQRNRAVMTVLERGYGSLEQLQSKHVYLEEAISGFATRMQELLPKLTLSEYL